MWVFLSFVFFLVGDERLMLVLVFWIEKTGFYLQLWDRLLGSIYTGPCLCAGCSTKRGERTREEFEKVEKVDYSCLLRAGYWWEGLWVGKGGKQVGKGE